MTPHSRCEAIKICLLLSCFTVKGDNFQNTNGQLIGANMDDLISRSGGLLLLHCSLEHRHNSVGVRVGHRVKVGYSVGCHATGGRYEKVTRCLVIKRAI